MTYHENGNRKLHSQLKAEYNSLSHMKEACSQFAANHSGLFIFIKSTSLLGKYIDVSRGPSAILYFPVGKQPALLFKIWIICELCITKWLTLWKYWTFSSKIDHLQVRCSILHCLIPRLVSFVSIRLQKTAECFSLQYLC